MAIDENLLVTPAKMGAIDAAAARGGIDSFALMQAAGAHVAAVVLAQHPQVLRAVVLCGPGNNGGDGHVAARALMECGVDVARFGMRPKPGGDAARAFEACPGQMAPLDAWRPLAGDVVVDALFGAGLDRAVGEDAAAAMARAEAAKTPIIAVDLPSGLSGRTGAPTGPCFAAADTVTFAALKPGHLLMPGRALCGRLHLCDIGIPARLIASDERLWRNHAGLYREQVPAVDAAAHKYTHGHLVVFSGPLISSGAARLSACAGLRAGAGLVTVASPPGAVMTQASHLTAVMQRSIGDLPALSEWLGDRRLSAFVLGPGFGDADKARSFTLRLAETGRPVVLDADGLSAFAESRDALATAFSGETRLVLTPHEGEFRRLFPDLADDTALSKVDRARAAARQTNAVVVFKGTDTVIAAPDGRAAINADAPAWLATAGSGDVLAGILGGLLAQAMPPFEAACAAVAMHGQAARDAGAGMTAEDLAACVVPPDRSG